MDRCFRRVAAPLMRQGLLGLLVVLSPGAVLAQSSSGSSYRALWPLPQAPLQPVEAQDARAETAQAASAAEPEADADAGLFSPLAMPQPAIGRRAGRTDGTGRPIPVGIIRQGLPAQGFPAEGAAFPGPTARAVGVKLGADVFAVSTKLVSPNEGAASDARIDWRLARPIAGRDTGFVWAASTGGGSGVASRPEQNADLTIGYRQPVFTHLVMTSQITMQGNYVFAPGDGGHSAIVPEVKLSADLNALAKLPFDASFDLGLARQMPVLASQYETRGSAMLRLKYSLD